MAPTKKSIYRQPGSQHFQLVHRSVRDPLAHDPEANKHVFKPVARYNESADGAVTLADLEKSVDKSKIRPNEGQAAEYGIAFDDSAYDYMQHLRPVGEGGFDSVLLAAPAGGAVPRGVKGKEKERDMFKMPEDALASKKELSVHDVYASQEAIPPELQGLQPDMDPHLRQVLEALDDDAFVDGSDDVFGELLGSGELAEDEEPEDFEFAEWGVGGDDEDDAKTEDGRGETWEDRFKAFKAAGGVHKPASNGGWESDDADSAERSEMADTVGSLSMSMADMMVRGGKKRKGKRGPSDASGMSMSSASVYRSDGLRTLDDRFDRIEREYELDDEDEEWDDEDDDGSIAPSMMSSISRVSFLRGDEPTGGGPMGDMSRDDFDAIMDDFLDNYEVVGQRMRASLGDTKMSGPDKLKVLRAALEDGVEGPSKEENRKRILEIERRIATGSFQELKETLDRDEVEQTKEKWDVETILSTYTNTENIPGTIRVRSGEEARARAQRRAEAAAAAEAAQAVSHREEEEEEEDSGSETEKESRVTVARPKGESAEERKARKAAVKTERANRRAEKKRHTETFGNERKRQLASQKKLVAGGRAADLAVGTRPGVVSLS